MVDMAIACEVWAVSVGVQEVDIFVGDDLYVITKNRLLVEWWMSKE